MLSPNGQVGSPECPDAVDEVTGALSDLGKALAGEEDLRTLMNHVCEQATRAIAGVDEASVTLLQNGEAETAASTSHHVVHLDANQYRAGRGPCVEAARSGELVRVKIDEAGDRWPDFIIEARAAGVGSFLSAPLVVNEETSGAVNCYSASDHGFAEFDAQLLELYTKAVEIILRTYHRYIRARALAEQLAAALESRAVIDQAKGIIMAARGITAAEAFAVLVEQSQRENIKVRAVAERFVASLTEMASEPQSDSKHG